MDGANDQRDSPRSSLRFDIGGKPAQLCYGRPAARGRRIFGELVPFDHLWRTGANEPTVLLLPFPAVVAGIRVPRGRYSVYSIPHESRWTLVLNRSTRQSGRTREEAGKHGNRFPDAYTSAVRAAEVGRAPVRTVMVPYRERLTAMAKVDTPRQTTLVLEWERTGLLIPIVS